MTKLDFYGLHSYKLDSSVYPGKLIVIEGTDGVGRTTQTLMLRSYLESQGFAVVDTGAARSELAGKGIKRAKEGHTLGPTTLSLFYATDFADRFEKQILPALKAGFIVLNDRYIYSLIIRAIVRGVDKAWLKEIYGTALKPDIIFYLKIAVKDLIPRVLGSKGFNFWESGMDLRLGNDLYESFVNYQTNLIAELDQMSKDYGFVEIDATREPQDVFLDIKNKLNEILV
ncbi:MAG: thymidylate kinase [Candidatus Melainabacteria bacterium]|nr:thymidylate kinase [Candidatus Melainabacteria bacterium]